MNKGLRYTEEDRQADREGMVQGTIIGLILGLVYCALCYIGVIT